MYVAVVSPGWRGYRVSVYDGEGRLLAEERVEAEQVVVRGALEVRLTRGMGGVGLVAVYRGEPRLEKRGPMLEVLPRGASGGEE